MSEAIDDMDAYIQLTDDVFQQILHSSSTDEKMKMVQNVWFSICLPVQHILSHYYRLVVSCNDYKEGNCTSASINLGRRYILFLLKHYKMSELKILVLMIFPL